MIPEINLRFKEIDDSSGSFFLDVNVLLIINLVIVVTTLKIFNKSLRSMDQIADIRSPPQFVDFLANNGFRGRCWLTLLSQIRTIFSSDFSAVQPSISDLLFHGVRGTYKLVAKLTQIGAINVCRLSRLG